MCKIILSKDEFVQKNTSGPTFEIRQKFEESKFGDLFKLAIRAARYEWILLDKQDEKFIQGDLLQGLQVWGSFG